MSRAFFFAHYTAWALIWGHVLFYYASFAYREWRLVGGRFRDVPRDLKDLLYFTFVPMFANVLAVYRHQPVDDTVIKRRYSKSHRMSFFIAMAAITYMTMGVTYSVFPDRTLWSGSNQLFSNFLVACTSTAGLGHLYTALEEQPRRWRMFVMMICAWYPLSIFAYNHAGLG